MSDHYTGVKVVDQIDPLILDSLYSQKKIPSDFLKVDVLIYPHMCLVLKSQGEQSALARVSGDGKHLILIKEGQRASDIEPKNKEQRMAMSLLMDDNIPLNIMTGRAGTGKTLLSLAVALEKIEARKYERLIITRPMSQVGRYDLGALPGDVNEKIGPYLLNYMSNIEQIVGRKQSIDAMEQYNIEVIPLQLMRGASFTNSFILADELQILDHHEMLTLGTRIGEGSKMVLMGDLNQRDVKIARNKTGIWKLGEDEKVKDSALVSFIELIKVERSAICQLFSQVFEE